MFTFWADGCAAGGARRSFPSQPSPTYLEFQATRLYYVACIKNTASSTARSGMYIPPPMHLFVRRRDPQGMIID